MEHLTVLEEYLTNQDSQVEALKILLSVSTDPQTLQMLEECKTLIRKVIGLAVEDKTANIALQVLINISQSEGVSEVMVKNSVFSTLFEYLSKYLPLISDVYSLKLSICSLQQLN